MKRMKLPIIGLVALLGMANAADGLEAKSVAKTTEHQEKSRIVVMDFGALDTINALDAADRVIGLPQSNLPEYLSQFSDQSRYFNTGGMKSPDLEKIAEHKPDLIITSPRQGQFVDELKEIAETYSYTIDGKDYLLSLEKKVNYLGSLINRPDEAKIAWDKLITKLKANKKIVGKSNQSALVILHNEGKLWPSSRGGFATLIHNVLGVNQADTIMADKPEAVTDRYLQMQNPDIIYIIDRSEAIGAKGLDLAYFERPELKEVSAVKSGKVIYLTPKLWYLSGNGLESVQLQIDEVMKAFTTEK